MGVHSQASTPSQPARYATHTKRLGAVECAVLALFNRRHCSTAGRSEIWVQCTRFSLGCRRRQRPRENPYHIPIYDEHRQPEAQPAALRWPGGAVEVHRAKTMPSTDALPSPATKPTRYS